MPSLLYMWNNLSLSGKPDVSCLTYLHGLPVTDFWSTPQLVEVWDAYLSQSPRLYHHTSNDRSQRKSTDGEVRPSWSPTGRIWLCRWQPSPSLPKAFELVTISRHMIIVWQLTFRGSQDYRMLKLKAVCLLDVYDMLAIDEVFEECTRQDKGSGKTNLFDVSIYAMLGYLPSMS